VLAEIESVRSKFHRCMYLRQYRIIFALLNFGMPADSHGLYFNNTERFHDGNRIGISITRVITEGLANK
jgi:hypothetical protein